MRPRWRLRRRQRTAVGWGAACSVQSAQAGGAGSSNRTWISHELGGSTATDERGVSTAAAAQVRREPMTSQV